MVYPHCRNNSWRFWYPSVAVQWCSILCPPVTLFQEDCALELCRSEGVKTFQKSPGRSLKNTKKYSPCQTNIALAHSVYITNKGATCNKLHPKLPWLLFLHLYGKHLWEGPTSRRGVVPLLAHAGIPDTKTSLRQGVGAGPPTDCTKRSIPETHILEKKHVYLYVCIFVAF